MTDELREAAQMALDALEYGLPVIEDFGAKEQLQIQHKAIAALYESLRARLAQPEQEPVWVEVTTNTGDKFILDLAVEADKIRAAKNVGLSVVPLYTAPPQRDEAPAKAVEWQGMTDEELLDIADMAYANDLELLQTLQAKLKEKNHG